MTLGYDGSSLDEAAERDLARVNRANAHRMANDDGATAPPAGWQLRRIGTLLAQPSPTDWLIRGVLSADTVCCTFGASGAGKSFVVVGKACCVATGTPWHGRAVKQGPVVYLAGEGHHGLHKRFLAWSVENNVDLNAASLHVSSTAIDVAGNHAAIIEAIKAECGNVRPVYVAIDTLHRHLTVGANENSGEDVAPFLAAADAIRQAFGCCVDIVHHVGHGAGDRERGWSGMRGAFDWSYSVTKGDAGPLILQCRKAKDHDEPEPMTFALESVELPWRDEYGETETSAVLRAQANKADSRLGGNQLIAMLALRKLIYAAARSGDPVTEAEWREAANLPRNRWGETRGRLVETGVVSIFGGIVQITEGEA